MKKLPIGIQTFRELITQDYLYIDKTRDIYELFASGGKYFFLSRPRRFGKSLLISTLKEIFSGSRQLFKGLWIYHKIKWEKHPVVHLDFTEIAYDDAELLKKSLEEELGNLGKSWGLTLSSVNYKTQFKELIQGISVNGKVVILIDEYDKPIIDKIEKGQLEAASECREILKEFYTVIKALDEHVRFAFIAGVSKFSKVSIFSGLNNLNDITMDDRFSTILGYTQKEFLHYFEDRITSMAEAEAASTGVEDISEVTSNLLQDIRSWYNGYSFDGRNFVYNPHSVLIFFSRLRFGNYWFETGTPGFLIKLINKYNVDVTQLANYKAAEAIFETFDIERLHVISLLFQSGYLTIKKVIPAERRQRLYILSFPNREVKESLLGHILGDFSSQFADEVGGVGFDKELRNLKEYKVESLK